MSKARNIADSNLEKLQVDSPTLVVDEVNGFVGVGTSTPANKLHIIGSTQIEAVTNTVNGNHGRIRLNASSIADFGTTLDHRQGTENETDASILVGGSGGSKGRITFSTTLSGNAVERMRIDSTGNVGIGVTNPTNQLTVNTAGGTGNTAGFNVTRAAGNVTLGVFVSGQSVLDSSSAFNIYENDVPIAQFSDSNINFRAGGAERMRINSSGNVGIGTGAPIVRTEIVDEASVAYDPVSNLNASGVPHGTHLLVRNSSSSGGTFSGIGFLARNTRINYIGTVAGGSGSEPILVFGAKTGGSTSKELMRIDSSGNVLIGTTSDVGATGAALTPTTLARTLFRQGTNSTLNNLTLQQFNNPNGVQGRIVINANSVTFETSSDYRLKEDEQPIENPVGRLMSLKPINFAWKVNGSRVDGFLAHEVQPFVPEAVTGEKDGMKTEEYEVEPAKGEIFIPAIEEVLDEEGEVITEAQDEQIIASDVVQPETLEDGQQWRETTPKVMGEREVPDYQGIDQSKLVPLLTAALQDAIKRIEALESQLAD